MRDKEWIIKQTDVAFVMLKQLVSTNTSNFVFSPLSLYAVLSLITAGSGGATRDQLLSFLKAKSVDQLNSLASHFTRIVSAKGIAEDVKTLSFASGVWLADYLRLKPGFKDVIDKHYKASVNLVDFWNKAEEVREEVNKWVEEETKGLIKGFRSKVDPSTQFILVNALYFNGAWEDPFDQSKTKDYDFFLLDGTTVRVPFMTYDEQPCVSVHDGFKILRLPYHLGVNEQMFSSEELKDMGSFSMHVLLPDAKDGLKSLIDRICSQSGFLQQCKAPYLDQYFVRKFRIPKFKMSVAFEPTDALQELGLVLPFDGGCLSEMVEPPHGEHLQVSRITQKVFIEVDEKGTEAAAVTSADDMGCSMYQEPPVVIDFVADHPFLFLIKEHRTGSLLFLGQVLNPLDGS